MLRLIMFALSCTLLATCTADSGFGDADRAVMRDAVYRAAEGCERLLADLPHGSGPAEAGHAALCVERILARKELRVYERAVLEKLRAATLALAGEAADARRLYGRLMKTKGLPSGFYARVAEAQAALGDDTARRLVLARKQDDILPRERVAPRYPRAAMEAGVEGCVIVEFTVEESGRTSNVGVVHTFPPHVFDVAAVEAVQGFRYAPPLFEGRPVKAFGVRYMFTFELPDPDEAASAPPECA